MNIGEKLVSFRKEKELTQEEVSKKLNIPKSKISKWERNELYPEIDDVVSLCKLYDITPNDLLSDEHKRDDSTEKRQKGTMKIITSLVGLLTLIVYLFVSFITGAWGVTWIIWIIYLVVIEIIKLCFHLKGVDVDDD